MDRIPKNLLSFIKGRGCLKGDMGKIAVLILVSMYATFFPILASADCEKWFKKANLQKDKDCLLKCASLPIDMGTFHCPNSCDDLCGQTSKEKWYFKISDLYPGITAAERALVTKNPKQMFLAYQLSWKAEDVCEKSFAVSTQNDASDACRHFVWAVLLAKEMGGETAQEILDAHEQNPDQPAEEKAMDLANNQRGVTFAKGSKDFSDDEVLREFNKLLKEGKLVILKSGK